MRHTLPKAMKEQSACSAEEPLPNPWSGFGGAQICPCSVYMKLVIQKITLGCLCGSQSLMPMWGQQKMQQEKQGRHKVIGKGWVCGKLDSTCPLEGAVASQLQLSAAQCLLAFFQLTEKPETRACVCVYICVLVYTKSLYF